MVKREGANKIPAALTMALAASMIVTLVGAAIAAWLLEAQTVSEDAVGVCGMLTVLLSAAAAALIAVGKVPQMRLVMCLSGGGIYLLGLLSCGALLFDGVKGGVLPAAAVIGAGCLAVFLAGMRSGRKPKYRIPRL